MEPSINDILDFLHGRGYNCKRVLLPSLGEYCFILRPPGFPLEGVDTRKQKIEYMITEFKKVGHILHNEYREATRPDETVGFFYSIELPSEKLKPLTCRLQQKNAERNAEDK